MTYLGVTEAELRESLRDGDTLAEIAQAEGETRAGLIDAMAARPPRPTWTRRSPRAG